MIERKRGWILMAAMCIAVVGVLAPANVVRAGAYLNEVHYDNASTDVNEFIEVVLDGGTSAADVTVSLYNGSDRLYYSDTGDPGRDIFNVATDFTAHGELEPGRFYYSMILPENGLQNGAPDGIAVDISGVLAEFWSYEGTFTAEVGPANGVESVDMGVSESSSAPIGSSLQRVSITGSEWQFTSGVNSMGAVNLGGPAQGACCNADGTCQILTSAECTGTYQGDGTSCSPNPCPQPTGACCLRISGCVDNTTFSDCINMDGWYEGDGTVCTGRDCTGACCLYNEGCDDITQLSCVIADGFYIGNGTECVTAACPTQQPVIISEYYEADGVKKAIELYNTSASPITLDGHRLALWANDNADLSDPNNTYDLDGLTIGANDVLVFVNSDQDLPPNLTVTPIVAPSVINFNGDDAIAITFGSDIVDVFGVPGQRDDGPRSGDPYANASWERDCSVTVGVADFDSCNFDSLKECALAVACPPGTPVVEPVCADGVNAGQWVFEGRDNTNHSLGSHGCPVSNGACCLPNGTCIEATMAECATNIEDGSYLGDGTTCSPNSCPQPGVGACCDAYGGCSTLNAFDCAAAVGIYRGDGTACGSIPCSFSGEVAINEIRVDQPSTDDDEYVELVGTPGFDLTGLSYIVIGDLPDNTGVIESVVSLDGVVIPADGHLLIAPDTISLPGVVTPTIDVVIEANTFENSDNVTHLLVGGLTGEEGDDLDLDDNRNACSLESYPWAGGSSGIIDGVALVANADYPTPEDENCVYYMTQVGPDDGYLPGHVYRFPDGMTGFWTIGQYNPDLGTDTPGIANAQLTGACCLGETCTEVFYDDCDTPTEGVYKGTGVLCSSDPCTVDCTDIETGVAPPAVVGTGVRVCDVIISSVADTISSASSKSIYVQDASGPGAGETYTDRGVALVGSNDTIDAILATPGVAVGARVDVEGVISDYNGQRQLGNETGFLLRVVQVIDNPGRPAPVVITAADLQDGSAAAEELENVRVTVKCVAFVDGDDASGFDGGTNYVATDGTNTFDVRVPTDDIAYSLGVIPSGLVNLTGILGQYDSTDPRDGGYQLLLTEYEDIGVATDCVGSPAACCMPDGLCRMLTQSICESSFGTYNAGQDCFSVVCVPVGTGACCLPAGCQDAVDPDDCCTGGGVYRGDGSSCGLITPDCDGLLDMAALQAGGDGQSGVVTKEVVVSSTFDTANSTYSTGFQVQDASGPGGAPRAVTVYGPSADLDPILATLAVGNRIVLSGDTSSYNGLLEFVNIEVLQNCGGTTPVAPTPITTDDMLDGAAAAEEFESVLVRLTCVEFDDAGGTFAYGNHDVTDGTNTVAVRVPREDSPIIGATIPTGLVDVIGILSQYDSSSPYDSGYQLLIRTIDDIAVCSSASGSCCISGNAGARAACMCPGDINGDLVVNLDDVDGFVDALLGNTINDCADVDENGLVNGDDIDDFVLSALDLTTCIGCVVATADDCALLGGVFEVGGTCDPFPCGPTGACCAADTVTCTDDLTYEECIASDPTANWIPGGTCAIHCGSAMATVEQCGIMGGPACPSSVCHYVVTDAALPGGEETRCQFSPYIGELMCVPCPNGDCASAPVNQVFEFSPYDCYFTAQRTDEFGTACTTCQGTIQFVELPASDTVRVATWNLLRYGDEPTREDDFRTVLNEIQPDILIAQELEGAAAANDFLNDVLNHAEGPGGYTMADFTNGSDTDNAMYYRSAMVTYTGAHATISTSPRITDRWNVTVGGESLYIYAAHLKAGSTSGDAIDRNSAANQIRANVSALGNANIIVGGDLNLYNSSEAAFVTLTGAGAGQVNDPIATSGNWHNNGLYSLVHTQSTHSNNPDAPNGAITGGMDDRFDFLLVSGALNDASGMEYIVGSYDAYGNDGLHFNKDINDTPVNLYGQSIADALHAASDHVPVIMDIQLP